MARSPLITGAQVVCYVNGSVFGRTADLNWSSESPRRPIHVVDWLQPWELVQTALQMHGTITIYRLHRDGGVEGAGMMASWSEITKEKYFSIMVVDRVTDTVMFRADKCSVTGQSWRLGRGYVMGTINFTALDWSNDTGPSTE